MSTNNTGRLAGIGVYGFHRQETVILAALVSGDPLLLIGRSGTGKTFLLNSVSEALGLEHRHYNASLISFDDLVGFPYPDEGKQSVRFLETPATVWGAESVLIDEISRCKPEHQNRLFSLIHERRVQGLPLPRLRYRWAAMNPCSTDQSGGRSGSEDYMGSEPLDPALADRFAVIVSVGDWDALNAEDRRQVVTPAGEGAVASDDGRLHAELAAWQATFAQEVEHCPAAIVDYVCAVVTALRDGGIRLSPRRARLIARTLLAASIVTRRTDKPRFSEQLFRRVLKNSLPQPAWGETPDPDKIGAAHRLAWNSVMLKGPEQWVHRFHLEKQLDRKAALLLHECPDADTGTLVVEQLLANEPKERAAAFAFAAFPAAVAGRLLVGAEAINDLGRFAAGLLTVNGQIDWQERIADKDSKHPGLAAWAPLLESLPPARAARARQLFYYFAIEKIAVLNAQAIEQEFDSCVRIFAGEGVQ